MSTDQEHCGSGRKHKGYPPIKNIVVVVENTEGVHRSRTLRRAVRNIKSMKIGVDSTKKSEVQF